MTRPLNKPKTPLWHHDAFQITLTVLVGLLIIASTIGIRLWMAAGDAGCAIANDPALCAAIKETR